MTESSTTNSFEFQDYDGGRVLTCSYLHLCIKYDIYDNVNYLSMIKKHKTLTLRRWGVQCRQYIHTPSGPVYNVFVRDFLPRSVSPLPSVLLSRSPSARNRVESENFYYYVCSLISARIRQQVDVVIAWSFSSVSATAVSTVNYCTFFVVIVLVFFSLAFRGS